MHLAIVFGRSRAHTNPRWPLTRETVQDALVRTDRHFVHESNDVDRNVAYRSTFVVDRDGVLRWGQAGDREMVRDGREILRVLDVIEGLRRKR